MNFTILLVFVISATYFINIIHTEKEREKRRKNFKLIINEKCR